MQEKLNNKSDAHWEKRKDKKGGLGKIIGFKRLKEDSYVSNQKTKC